MITRAKDLSEWIRQQVTLAGARGVVVGLTGAPDSAVVARLCQMAVPGRVIGAMTPCQTDPRDEHEADLIARQFDVPVVRVDLEPAYDRLVGDLDAMLLQLREDRASDGDAPSDNQGSRTPSVSIKPRLRMSALYFLAESLNCLVVGAANRSDLTVGSFTKYGDAAVDLLPLGQLLESEVRALARELEVPGQILDRTRADRAGSRAADEGQMGFSYADLERYLNDGPDGVSPALAMRIERLLRNSEHRRAIALIPEL
jgi:NAD+ synthase